MLRRARLFFLLESKIKKLLCVDYGHFSRIFNQIFIKFHDFLMLGKLLPFSQVFKVFQDRWEPCYMLKNICFYSIVTNTFNALRLPINLNVSYSVFSVIQLKYRLSLYNYNKLVQRRYVCTFFPLFKCSRLNVMVLNLQFPNKMHNLKLCQIVQCHFNHLIIFTSDTSNHTYQGAKTASPGSCNAGQVR